MKTSYSFRAIIEPDDPKGFHGFVPRLKGVHTFGATISDTKKNIREAIRCHLEGLLKDGERIPSDDDAIEVIETVSPNDLRVAAYA